MADPDSYAITFKRAVAQHLADTGVGVYGSGVYAATDRGIYTNGPTMPTTGDNCLVLTWLSPVPDGRSGMLYRVQIFSRVKGSSIAAENLAEAIARTLDQRQAIPAGHDVAWVDLFSEVAFSADTSGRCSTSQTFHFMGRRRPL